MHSIEFWKDGKFMLNVQRESLWKMFFAFRCNIHSIGGGILFIIFVFPANEMQPRCTNKIEPYTTFDAGSTAATFQSSVILLNFPCLIWQ